MYTTTRDIKKAFYALFGAPTTLPIIGKNTTKPVPYHFETKSGMDYAQQDNQTYPCIVIKDYPPELSKRWGTAWEVYEANARAVNNDEGIIDTITRYPEPQRVRFRFDVSIVAKEYNDYASLEDYMFKTFQMYRSVILNPQQVPINGNGDTATVGVPVMLEPVAATKLDRPDGLLDTNYEIAFEATVYLETEDVDTVQQVIVSFSPYDTLGNSGPAQEVTVVAE